MRTIFWSAMAIGCVVWVGYLAAIGNARMAVLMAGCVGINTSTATFAYYTADLLRGPR